MPCPIPLDARLLEQYRYRLSRPLARQLLNGYIRDRTNTKATASDAAEAEPVLCQWKWKARSDGLAKKEVRPFAHSANRIVPDETIR